MAFKPENISCIALDVDGTLLDDNKVLRDQTRESLIQLESQGYILCLVSGRSLHSMEDFANQLQLKEFSGYLVGLNGGSLYDYKNEELLEESLVDAALMGEYFSYWPADILTRAAYQDRNLFTDTPDKDDVGYLESINNMNVIPVEDLSQLPVQVHKMMIAGQREKIIPYVEEAKEAFGDRLSLTFSTQYYFEAMPKGVNKGRGLKKIANYLGISLDEILAFGDGENDISLLENAGYGVAMANASDKTKAVADEESLSNNEEGIYHFLKKYKMV